MDKVTPMMKQYASIKNEYQESLLFYRLGDFYELFYEDAITVAKECDLILTSRSKDDKDKVPMCGVPYHSVDPYIQKLLDRGYKIAIVEQMEDPSQTKGIVKREVVRVITPGTVIDETTNQKQTVTIASLEDGKTGFAVVVVEVASGKSKAFWINHTLSEVVSLCLKENVKELLILDSIDKKMLEKLMAYQQLNITTVKESNLESPMLKMLKHPAIKEAAARLYHYLQHTQKHALSHLQPIVVDNKDSYCYMDYSTMSNLELIEANRLSKEPLTLWSYLDHCKTAMGSRLLKEWVTYPLVDLEAILARQKQITWLLKNYLIADKCSQELKNSYDVEKITTKIAFRTVTPVDLVRLYHSLKTFKHIYETLKEHFFDIFKFDIIEDESLVILLQQALDQESILTVKDGPIFKKGYNTQLDSYRHIIEHGKDWLLAFENQERKKTNIKNLKIGYNRVFGYYIEVSKGNTHLVKPEFGYIRKQTLTNGERYISESLKQKEDELLSAKSKATQLEKELVEQLIDTFQPKLNYLQKTAAALATIDALLSMTKISGQHGFVAPTFNQNNQIHIEAGIHPLLQKVQSKQKVVANDTLMETDHIVQLLTGPNMGGKSTYMRQVALTIIMAQMGCYVLAKKADLPIFTAIFTRIGASDDILSGQSTFMVEMHEANAALSQANQQSLILFDEIGRGTSTYDGMAIAQAIIEYIVTVIKAKTIFSTHYHELTQLQQQLKGVVNLETQVIAKEEDITFLYKIKPGQAKHSYGVNVAKIAQLPPAIIERSFSLLKQLESNKRHVQQSLDIVEIKTMPKEVIQLLQQAKKLDINTMTPVQSMQVLSDMIELLKKVK